MRLLDLTDPGRPVALGSVTLPRGLAAGRTAFSGDRLYVATNVGGVAVLDVADPAAPVALAPAGRKMRVTFP